MRRLRSPGFSHFTQDVLLSSGPVWRAQLDRVAQKSWTRLQSLLEWKHHGGEVRGTAVCISHANLISAAVIESCRNLPPVPGETEELVYY